MLVEKTYIHTYIHLRFYFYIGVLRIGAKTLCSLVNDFDLKGMFSV